MVCCFACRSHPTIFISASSVPSLWVRHHKVYSGRREADVVMSSVIQPLRAGNIVKSFGVYVIREMRRRAKLASPWPFNTSNSARYCPVENNKMTMFLPPADNLCDDVDQAP